MLWFVFAVLYTQLGYRFGKDAIKTWREKDNESLKSLLYFPATHFNGEVGKQDSMWVRRGEKGPIEVRDAVGPMLTDPKEYLWAMTFLWPIKAAVNAAILASFVGPAKAYDKAKQKYFPDPPPPMPFDKLSDEVKLLHYRRQRDELEHEIDVLDQKIRFDRKYPTDELEQRFKLLEAKNEKEEKG